MNSNADYTYVAPGTTVAHALERVRLPIATLGIVERWTGRTECGIAIPSTVPVRQSDDVTCVFCFEGQFMRNAVAGLGARA